MRWILLILFLSLTSRAQDNRYAEWQSQWYDKAISHLKAGEFDVALHFFASAEDILSHTSIARKAAFKYDSLLPIARKKLLNDIRGEWKLIKQGSNWGYTEADVSNYKILLITDEFIEISEFKSGKKVSVQKENIKYYTAPKEKDYGLKFIFSSKSVWHIRTTGSNLSMTYLGDINKYGGYNEIVCGNEEMYFERKLEKP